MKIIFEKKVFDHPLKTSVVNYLDDLKTGKAAPKSFDEIRAMLSKTAAELPDGVIHQIALDAGFEVVQE